MRRSLTTVFALLLVTLVPACNFGNEPGRFETIEDEIQHVESALRGWIEGAFPNSEVIGFEVWIISCDPSDDLLASVELTVNPRGDVMAARAAALDRVEATGATVDRSLEHLTFSPVFFAIPGTDVDVAMETAPDGSTRPGINVVSSTGCYDEDRIRAEDPFSLRHSEGESIRK